MTGSKRLDRAAAYRWFGLAASQGDEEADEIPLALSAELTEAEWQQVLGWE